MLEIKHIERWVTEDGCSFEYEDEAIRWVLHKEMDKYLLAFKTEAFTKQTYNISNAMSVHIFKDIPDELYKEIDEYYGIESLPREKGKWVCEVKPQYGQFKKEKPNVKYYCGSDNERWRKVD